jgi:hypothetical protein
MEQSLQLKPNGIIFGGKVFVCLDDGFSIHIYFRTMACLCDFLLVLAQFVRKSVRRCLEFCQSMPNTFEKGYLSIIQLTLLWSSPF